MSNDRFDPLGAIKEVLLFLAVSVLAFGWMFLMMGIISFVALSYITIRLKAMILVSIAFMILIDIYYVIRRTLKKREEERIRRRLGK